MTDPKILQPMTREEMRTSLEMIARGGSSDAARVSAIRQLRLMDQEDRESEPGTPAGDFDDLYGGAEADNVAQIRRK